VALLVSVLMLGAWGLFLQSQLAELRHYSWQVAPLAFGLSVIAGALHFAALAFCWALLLLFMSRALGGVRLAAAMRVWLLSMMARYIPGNVWHIVSRVAMAGHLRVNVTQVVSSATIEQGMTLLGALVMVGITLPFWGVLPGRHVWWLLLLPMGLLLIHPRIMGSLMAWAAVRLKRPELAWEYTYRDILMLLLANAGANLLAGLALFLLLSGMTDVHLADVPLLVGATALAWVVGYVTLFTPNGLGVREAALVALLSQVYPLPVAIVGSLLFRLVITLGEALAVLVSWVGGHITPGEPLPVATTTTQVLPHDQ
jgi:hypothetical protein